MVRARPLVDAVNDVFAAMGLDESVSVEDVKDIGFRLLYGKASLQHVGRGLTYLLPLVEYGLLLDPKRFDASTGDVSREEFIDSLTSYSLAALEGVPMMADWLPFGRSWRVDLERVLAASVVSAFQRNVPVVFLCHRIFGRNADDRSAVSVELVEVRRWRLSVSIRGAPPTRVPCVGRLRHVDVPWTTRVDDRLPDRHGPGLHPYCPPVRWMNSQTLVTRTHESRPCWRDVQGQWWARPSAGDGDKYHWDVWLNPQNNDRVGLSPINVTRDGAPANQGVPGDLHHVPTDKKQALKSTTGWRCPS